MSVALPHEPERVFRELVVRHEGRVLRLCRSILRDEHLGDDAAQDTFLKLWKRVLRRSVPERCEPWLDRVAISTSLDLVRRVRARDATWGEWVREAGAERVATPDAERELSGAELSAALERALHRLPDGQRAVFVLVHERGLSLADAARALDVAPSTAKTQFARACLKLQSRLSAHRTESPE